MCEKPGVANQGPGHKPFLFGRVCLSFPGGGDHPSFLSERGAGSGVKASGCHLHVAACQRWGQTMPLSQEPRAPARRLLSGLPASILVSLVTICSQLHSHLAHLCSKPYNGSPCANHQNPNLRQTSACSLGFSLLLPRMLFFFFPDIHRAKYLTFKSLLNINFSE